jgi:dTDP-4-dehydrorhamnose reductase
VLKKKSYKILVTGGSGRFGKILKTIKTKHKLLFPKKKFFNILKINQMKEYINVHKPNIIIHLAALSRPMKVHDENIIKSIDINIVGTANITKICKTFNIKLIYFSTGYVYPKKSGSYKEDDAVNPINNYALSKMGGECSVLMYKNSLILRASMTEKPFVHKEAFADVYTNFIYHKKAAQILMKILEYKGIINLGGKRKTIYNFVKGNNKIKKIYAKKNKLDVPLNSTMNVDKLNNILSHD